MWYGLLVKWNLYILSNESHIMRAGAQVLKCEDKYHSDICLAYLGQFSNNGILTT